MRRVERAVAALRRALPTSLLPLVVWLHFRLAWALPSVREDARRQMRFLLEVARPDSDVEAAARRYVRHMAWRAEARWHPELLTAQRVVGFEHLAGAVGLGRGVLVNYMHHGSFEGLSPSLARLGVRSYTMGLDHIFGDDVPEWLKQNLRISARGGNRALSVAIGSRGIADLLRQGAVVTLASDVPGRTPVRFAGRELLGSFGAARIPAETGSPVVMATAEVDERGPLIRLHPPLLAQDFASARDMLDVMLATHERAVLAWPEAGDIPMSRWGAVTSAAHTSTRESAR